MHEARWKDVAEESVRIIETLGRVDPEDYVAAADQTRSGRKDRWWLISLFADPIVIRELSYTNGQHRGCALRFSGAARAAVVTGDESLGGLRRLDLRRRAVATELFPNEARLAGNSGASEQQSPAVFWPPDE